MEKNNKVEKKFDVLVLIVIAILSVFLTITILQNDAFYSLAIGRDILKYGIDMIDHYSIHNLPYTYPHWLFDVCLYLVYSVFSFKGLYVLNIVFLFTITTLIYKVGCKFNGNKFFSAVLAIVSMFIMNEFVANRAQTITYILFILEIFCIENYMKTRKNRWLFFLSIILLIIFNVHVAVWPMFYVFMMPYCFEYFVSWFKNKEFNLRYFKKRKGVFINNETGLDSRRFIFEENESIKRLFAFIPFSLLIGLLTPIGLNSYTYIIKTFMGNSMSYIAEHQPVVLAYNKELLLLIIISIIVILFTKVKFKFRDFVMLSGLLIMTFSGSRHFAFFTIFWVLLFGRNIVSYIEKIDANGTKRIIGFSTKNIISIIIILISILIGFVNKGVSFKQNLEDQLIPEYDYPVDASNFIINELDYKNIRLYNGYNYGSYLLFRGIPVYIDSRADLYTKEFNGKKDIMEESDNYDYYNYGNLLKKNDITHIIIESGKDIIYMYDNDENLNKIYDDDKFLIYEVNYKD